MLRSRIILAVLVVLLATVSAVGQRRSRSAGEPGKFDYYVLSLSWSPEYCAGPGGSRDAAQCGTGRQFGFVVHGLWPQYERGFPESCAPGGSLPAKLVDRMLPLMPSRRLINHEWDKHGTCDGVDAERYFQKVESAFRSFRVPVKLQQPSNAINTPAAVLKREIAAANPQTPDRGMAILCGGRFLREVRVCLDRNLKPRACSPSVRDSCPSGDIIVRPVR